MKGKGKNSNGGGTLYQLKDGRWRAEFNWLDRSGAIKRKCWTSRKQSEVKQKLNDFKKTFELTKGNGIYERITFREYADYWVNQILRPKVKELSYRRKISTLKNQVYPYIGGFEIRELTFSDIQRMVNCLNERGLSFSTIKKAYEAVSSCLRFFRMENGSAFNPCEGISLPDGKRKDISDICFFDKKQREQIVKEATRTYQSGKSVYRLGWAFVLLMYSGMRVGELCALEWSDIDFEEKTISVNKTAIEVNAAEHGAGVITQNNTKTRNSVRVIPMTKMAFNSLMELKKINGSEKYVITSSNHKRIRPTRLDKTFYDILRAAALPKTGVHALRHTFASMLFNNGCEIKIVSDLLGHTSTKVTENIYIHLIQAQKIKAIQNIDGFSD